MCFLRSFCHALGVTSGRRPSGSAGIFAGRLPVLVGPKRPGHPREWRYGDQQLLFKQGDEMGRFLLGSTVVMLFPRGVMKFNAEWSPQRPIRLGEKMDERGGGGA